jgi:VanZ family protein
MLAVLFRLPAADVPALDRTLRTAAHFFCFAVLGALLLAALLGTFRKLRGAVGWAAGLCAGIGVLDEVKKAFVPGRHLSWPEAGINVISALVSIGLIAYYIWYHRANGAKRGAKAPAETSPASG